MRLATQSAYLTLQSGLAEPEDNDSEAPAATGLEQRERARLRARGVRVVKLAGQEPDHRHGGMANVQLDRC